MTVKKKAGPARAAPLTLGKLLILYRRTAGVSAPEAAAGAGLAEPVLRSLEGDRRRFDRELVVRVLAAIDALVEDREQGRRYLPWDAPEWRSPLWMQGMRYGRITKGDTVRDELRTLLLGRPYQRRERAPHDHRGGWLI